LKDLPLFGSPPEKIVGATTLGRQTEDGHRRPLNTKTRGMWWINNLMGIKILMGLQIIETKREERCGRGRLLKIVGAANLKVTYEHHRD